MMTERMNDFINKYLLFLGYLGKQCLQERQETAYRRDIAALIGRVRRTQCGTEGDEVHFRVDLSD